MGKLHSLVLASVVVAGAVPACGGGAAPGPRGNISFVNGTRLKAVHYEIDGAPPQFVGWQDTALGVACSFVAVDSPERLVCLPSEYWKPEFAEGTGFFADSDCRMGVAGSGYPGEARYVLEWPKITDAICATSTPRLFYVGSLLTDTTSLHTIDSFTGSCRPANATDAPLSYAALYVYGPEIPIDTLVKGTFRHESGPARIVPLTIAGSDGSFQGEVTATEQVLGWDNGRGEMVFAPVSLAPDSRWYPVIAYDTGYMFSNDTCTDSAAVGIPCQGVAKEAAAPSYEADACGRPTAATYFDLGGRLSKPVKLFYLGDSNSCVQAPDEWYAVPNVDTFSLGSVIPPTTFVEAVEARAGVAQVQVVQAASPGGSAVGPLGFFDSVHGQPCVARPAGDGATRCIPSARAVTDPVFFSDAACSQPLIDVPPDASCGPRPTLASIDERVAGAAPQRRHIYPLGEAFAGMTYTDLGGCTPFVELSASDGWYTIGPEIAPAELALMNLVRSN